jgi:hypothetical protein
MEREKGKNILVKANRQIGTVKQEVLILRQESTNYAKIQMQPPNSRHHKGNIKQVLY